WAPERIPVGMSHMLTTVCSKPSAKNIPIGIHINSARPTVLRVALDMTDPRLTSQLQRTPMPMAAHQPRTPYSIYATFFSAVFAMTVNTGVGPTGSAEAKEDQKTQAKEYPPSR